MSLKNYAACLKIQILHTTRFVTKAVLLIVSISLSGKAFAQDVPPVFTYGNPQALSVCENSGATNFSYQESVNPIIAGDNVTWTVALAPTHAALSGFPETIPTNDSVLVPSGFTYTPASGYSGPDFFVIEASDAAGYTYDTINVTVKPLPSLTSTALPVAICSGTPFTYVPASSIAGSAFAWHRNAVSGISNPAAGGTGSISETLDNVTYYDVTTVYAYTVTANGCSGTADVSLVVMPTPTLTGKLTDTICNGATLNYTVSSMTAGASISWSRASVTGISPAISSGTGNISETLTNSTSAAVNTVYAFEISAGGCSSTRDLTVTVEPPVPATGITTAPGSSLCDNTMYQNFGTNVAPGAGVVYEWSASNATIYAQGASNQYILVNFTNPGNAYVTLTATVPGSACNSIAIYSVSVSTATATSADVLFNGEQFVYTDNTPSAYQWGVDNMSTLDSSAIAGATFQSYPNSSPDFTDNYYWVITTDNGCTQKTYYHAPTAVTTVSPATKGDLKVYPNPAGNVITADMNNLQANTMLVLTDMMGRIVNTMIASQQSTQVNIAGLPAGSYTLTRYNDGARIATAIFIKN